jgi:hypothetical protein
MGTLAKKYLYIGVLIALLAPALQPILNLPHGYLEGVTYAFKRDTFTVTGWFDGSWQENTTAYVEENLGFRSFFVRCKNQIEFQFFNNTISWILVGKDQYVYDKKHVEEYLGWHKIPFNKAREKIRKLKYLQERFQQNGQHLILVIPPCRTKMLPEYLPDNYKIYPKGLSNYDQYLFLAEKYQINTVDFSSWFEQKRSSSRYPLFTKYGVHWSVYSATLATDSLIRYMEYTAGRKWCDLKIDEPVATHSPNKIDVDLINVLNLATVPTDNFYYAQTYVHQTGKFPKVLVVGDSFVWTMLESNMLRQTFGLQSKYLFYNHDMYRIDCVKYEPLGTKEKTDAVPELDSYEFVILVYSEALIEDLGSSFIETTYDSLTRAKLKKRV